MTMEQWVQMLITIVTAVLASSGLWAFIQKITEKKDAKTRMLIGLGHDRIVDLAMHYIDRGWITQDEYENLDVYLFQPYHDLGGNGTAERLMREVDKLEIRSSNGHVVKEGSK